MPEWIDIDDHNDLKQFYERKSNEVDKALHTMKYLTEMFTYRNYLWRALHFAGGTALTCSTEILIF